RLGVSANSDRFIRGIARADARFTSRPFGDPLTCGAPQGSRANVATSETGQGSHQASDESDARNDFGPRNPRPMRSRIARDRGGPASPALVQHAAGRDNDAVSPLLIA